MATWFSAEIERRRKENDFGTDMMGALMTAADALDDDGVRRGQGRLC